MNFPLGGLVVDYLVAVISTTDIVKIRENFFEGNPAQPITCYYLIDNIDHLKYIKYMERYSNK